MKADRTGTPAEQARALQGWQAPMQATEDCVPKTQRCDSCLWHDYGSGRTVTYRCRPGNFATRAKATCADWERAAQRTEANRTASAEAELRAIRRTLADPTLMDSERCALTARRIDLERQLASTAED
jgi:hypothetical protein